MPATWLVSLPDTLIAFVTYLFAVLDPCHQVDLRFHFEGRGEAEVAGLRVWHVPSAVQRVEHREQSACRHQRIPDARRDGA